MNEYLDLRPPMFPDWGRRPPPPPPPNIPGGDCTVIGYDMCGNLIVIIKRPRECIVNGCPTSCRKYY